MMVRYCCSGFASFKIPSKCVLTSMTVWMISQTTVSISHAGEYAIATVILVGEDSVEEDE